MGRSLSEETYGQMRRIGLAISLVLGLMFVGASFSAAQATRCQGGVTMYGYAEAWSETTAIQLAKDDAKNGCESQGGLAGAPVLVDSGWLGGQSYPAWASAKCCCVLN